MNDGEPNLCSRWWRDDNGDHHCDDVINPGHLCQCCCGAVDYTVWDMPARLTPGLKRRGEK